MKSKKFWAMLLTLVMALSLSLSLPALASGGSSASSATTLSSAVQMDGSVQVGKVEVVIGGGSIVLNPYQLEYSIPSSATGSASSATSYRQIISPPVKVLNTSTYTVAVDANIIGSSAGSAKFVTSAPAATVKTNDVFLWADFKVTNSSDTAPSWDTDYNTRGVANQILVEKVGDNPKENVATLPVTDGTKANVLWFKFNGSMARAAQWTKNDKVSANVALTFRPIMSEAFTVNVTTTATGTASGSYTLSHDSAPAGTEVILTLAPATDSKATITWPRGVTGTKVNDSNDKVWKFNIPTPGANVVIGVKWELTS